METYLFYFVTIAAVVFITQKILFWTALLQENDYKIRKTFSYLHNRGELQTLFFGWENLVHVILIFFYFGTIIESRSAPFYSYFVSAFFILFLIKTCVQILKRKVIVPHINSEVIIIFISVFPILCFLLLFPLLDDYFWYLFIAKLVPFFVVIVVWFLSIPKGFYKDFLILKSSQKISVQSGKKTIAIIGDTKQLQLNDLFYKFFSQDFSVVHTVGSGSTFEISKMILKRVKENTEIIIVDVDTSEQEELIEVIQLLRPDICVINRESHSLKRSFKQVISFLPRACLIIGIGELENSLIDKKNHIDIFDKRPQPKKIMHSSFAHDIVVHKTFMSFVAVIKNNSFRVKTQLIAINTVKPLLAVAVAAKHMRYTNSKINKRILSIEPFSQFLSHTIDQNGRVLINASHDLTSEVSLEFLSTVRGIAGKKIVIFSPSTEFGRKSKKMNQELGRKIAAHSTVLIVLNSEYSDFFEKGALIAKKKKYIKRMGVGSATEYINTEMRKKDIALFTGTQSGKVYDNLMKSDNSD